MTRALTLLIAAGLSFGAASESMAQSRTVSTADMPKPGVSYIQGPTPVRRDTVSTGSLPVPPHLYVGNSGASRDSGYGDPRNDRIPGNDDGYATTGYYGGNYDPGYQGSYRNGRDGRDHGRNHGYPGHGDHGNGDNGHGNGDGYGGRPDHDRPATSNSLAISTGPIKAGGPSTPGQAFNLSPPRRPDTAGNHGSGNGNGNNRPPVQHPGTIAPPNSALPIRPSQPATSVPVRQAGWRVN